jgi:glycosyltransferase involved in cell wall biosynthesis
VTPETVRGRERLLFLAPFPPRTDADQGGSRVLASLIVALSAHHDVGLVSVRSSEDRAVDDELAKRCAFVKELHVEQSASHFERLRRRLAPYLGVPQWAAYTWSRAAHNQVRVIAAEWKPTVVHLEYHVMGQYREAVAGAHTILTEYEPGVTAAREHLMLRSRASTFAIAIERRLWHRFERDLANRVDAVVTFTERDRAAIEALPTTTPVTCIPFDVDAPVATGVAPAEDPQSVVFVGNFLHPPNLEAAKSLVRDIFPRVRSAVPGATLTIVGANPPADLEGTPSPGVRCTGAVPEVASYLARAAVVAVPLRLGGGMRVKVVEALAAGKAVVATPLAAEGLTVRDGVHLAFANSDREFADAIIALLNSPGARRRLAEGALGWARSRDRSEWTARYEALYRSLAANK